MAKSNFSKPIHIFFIAYTLSIPQPSLASLNQCAEVAKKISESLPIRKDKISVLTSVSCLRTSPKNTLVHVVAVDTEENKDRSFEMERHLKPSVQNTYCSDPKIRPTLNAFDINFRYYNSVGVFWGEFTIRAVECG
jgi:hypothetical protein